MLKKFERMVTMMAMLWAQEIMVQETLEASRAMFKRCPRLLKERVRKILVDSGCEEMTEEGENA